MLDNCEHVISDRRRGRRGPAASLPRPAAPRHEPRGAARRRRDHLAGAAARGRRRRAPLRRPGRGRRRAARALRRPPRGRSPTSAPGSTGCRSPSSWPPPAPGRSRSPRSPPGSTIGSACSPAGRAPRCRASRRCAPSSTGATSCSSTTSSASSNGCRCSPAVATWRRPRPSAPTTTIAAADVADHLHALVDKSLVVAVPSGDGRAVHPAADARPVRPGAAHRTRRRGAHPRRDGQALRRAVRAERRRLHRRRPASVADGDRPGARQPPGGARLGRRQRRRRDRADDRRRRQLAALADRAW